MNEEIVGSVKIEPIKWVAKEFDRHNRSMGWYLGIGAVLLAVLAYTIYFKSWLLCVLVVMVGVALYFSGKMEPKDIECTIDEKGIKIGDKQFEYAQLKTFWFSKTEDSLKLNLITIFRFMPVISVSITNDLRPKINEALIQVMPESENKKEDWIDRISRILKV